MSVSACENGESKGVAPWNLGEQKGGAGTVRVMLAVDFQAFTFFHETVLFDCLTVSICRRLLSVRHDASIHMSLPEGDNLFHSRLASPRLAVAYDRQSCSHNAVDCDFPSYTRAEFLTFPCASPCSSSEWVVCTLPGRLHKRILVLPSLQGTDSVASQARNTYDRLPVLSISDADSAYRTLSGQDRTTSAGGVAAALRRLTSTSLNTATGGRVGGSPCGAKSARPRTGKRTAQNTFVAPLFVHSGSCRVSSHIRSEHEGTSATEGGSGRSSVAERVLGRARDDLEREVGKRKKAKTDAEEWVGTTANTGEKEGGAKSKNRSRRMEGCQVEQGG
jgi:hypothetical protein